MVMVMQMRTDDEPRQGDGGQQPMEHDGIIGDLCTGPLVEMDGSIDWSGHPDFDSQSISLAFLDRLPRGAFGLFRAVHDDDDVLDQWLASIPPDQFEHVFDRLAGLEDGPLHSLEPTA